MEKHFVTFYSPGTFVAEQTTKPIESWDVNEAMAMATKISERNAATPYGFKFSTRGRGENDLDSKVIKSSNFYYLGGEVMTLQQVKDKHDPKDNILISNMECNGWDRIVVNRNSWRWTQPLEESDVVLDFTPVKMAG